MNIINKKENEIKIKIDNKLNKNDKSEILIYDD